MISKDCSDEEVIIDEEDLNYFSFLSVKPVEYTNFFEDYTSNVPELSVPYCTSFYDTGYCNKLDCLMLHIKSEKKPNVTIFNEQAKEEYTDLVNDMD
ncbi:hypothetical protein ABK040_011045 [Willaertia magna]